MIAMKQQKNARLTAKPLLAIVNATVKKLPSECANGVSKTVKKHGSKHANGATENWLPQAPQKKPRFALLKLLKVSGTKIGVVTKYSPRMAGTDARVAGKLNGYFCRSTTSTMMVMLSVSLARIAAAAQRSIFGCVRTSSRTAIKCCA